MTDDHKGKQVQGRALEEVHALAFDGERLRHACQEDYASGFPFVRAMLNVMSGRLYGTGRNHWMYILRWRRMK